MFVVKHPLKTISENKYRITDAQQQRIPIIGETSLKFSVPNMKEVQIAKVLVLEKLGQTTIIGGLGLLQKWGVVRSDFPLPPGELGESYSLEGESLHGPKVMYTLYRF